MKSQSSELLWRTAEAINHFQFDFYNQFSEPENLVISPLGLYLVLAMLHEGARGKTGAVLSHLLHCEDPETSIASGLRMLLDELHSRTQLTAAEKIQWEKMEAERNEFISRGDEGAELFFGTATAEDVRFDLSIANGMWIQNGYECKSEFVETVRSEMEAEIGNLDFKGDPVNSCQEINDWIRERTRGLIETMLSPENIPELCRLILGNAIYFKARWQTEFADPVAGPFHLFDGSIVEAQMMTRNFFWGFKYMQSDSFLAFELPYYNRPVSMFIFMPTQYGKADFAEFEREFQQHFRSFQLYRQTESPQVELTMPEFKITAQHSFSGPVSAMSGQSIFQQEADFSGISDEKVLFVSDIIQDAHIAVDQHGTEAAAATFAAVFTGMPPRKNVILTIDHPFLFAIVDKPTGVILFVGKIVNPV